MKACRIRKCVGEVITAEIIRVDYNFVVVNAGLKLRAISRLKNSRMTGARLRLMRATLSVLLLKRLKMVTVKADCREIRQSA